MVNKVLDASSKALHTKFGSSYHYYKENVEQKAELPCFNLGVLNPLCRSVNRKDYRWTIPCVHHYFTNNKTTALNECYSVGEQALECLEYLDIDGRLIRGEDMSYTMVDDVLQIFITYRFWTEKPEAFDKMEELDAIESSVKK